MYFRRIRDLREDSDYRLGFVSSFIHCSIRSYQRYENGSVELSATQAIALAGLYNVSLDYLFGLSDKKGLSHRQICPPHRRLKYLRRKNHLTQEQVATKLFCRTDVYARFEQGVQVIPVQMAIILSQLYIVSSDYILGLATK